jgi:aryl-alcohol dehydrogenase-like predicted oxidoreductase
MKQRQFGSTGWSVGQIGFGSWQLGGTWGSLDRSQAVRTLHEAFDAGVNFVDTAPVYGDGLSEAIIGEALGSGQLPGKIYVATKVAPPDWIEPIETTADFRDRYPKHYIRRSVDASLQRLGVERLDLLQLHKWLPSGCVQLDWLEQVNELRVAGKIDRIGVSLRDSRSDEGIELASLGLVTSVQAVVNLFEQEPADQLGPACESSGTALIARVPLDSGSLTGTWTERTRDAWDDTDIRRQMYTHERFTETLRRVEALRATADRWHMTLPEMAFRYCLSVDGVAVVIPGISDSDELAANLPMGQAEPLPVQLMEELSAHRWQHAFYRNAPPLPEPGDVPNVHPGLPQ